MRLWDRSYRWPAAGVLLFLLAILIVFRGTFSWWMAPLAPDAMPFFPYGFHTQTVENLLATGGEATPQILYWLTLPPLLASKLTYIVDTFLLVLAGVYYLRARGTSQPAAWIGGLALGFCGYTFTLFSAGHRGYFHMFSCAVFSFGMLTRCFGQRRWFHFAMLGACLAWGVPYQPDVLVFVFMLAAAYALWLTFARRVDPSTPPWRRIVRVWPRFLVTAAVAAAIAMPAVRGFVAGAIAGRREQVGATSAGGSARDDAAKKRDAWIFATNWSLPPADIAEFIVPGIFGNDSFQPPYPYWGALGRPYDWQPGRRTMPNYRQHTVYLGGLTVCFALYAGLVWWRTRRRARGGAAGGDDPLVDVPFWMGAGVACLLLAMGRYTPVYRLFNALPYMDLVRCPVKFHHLVEICAAFLCGLGVEMWWRGAAVDATATNKGAPRTARHPVAAAGRILAWVAAGAGFVLLVAAGCVAAARADVARHIASLGLGGGAEALAKYTSENLVRAAGVLGAGALLFWMGQPRLGRSRPAAWLLAALAVTTVSDLALVARRFMRPIDMRPFYAHHVVSDTALARGGRGAGIANYVSGNDAGRDWFASSLLRCGLQLALDPGGDPEWAAALQALGPRTETLWRATHAQFVAAPWKAVLPLVKSGALTPLVSFTLGAGVVRSVQPTEDACVLCVFNGALPPLYVADTWRGGLDKAAQLQRMGAPDWDSAHETLCDAAGGGDGESHLIGQARVRARRGTDFLLVSVADVQTPQPGLLVWDERYANDLVARVDGRPAPVHVANAIWAAVEVPAGRHTIETRRRAHAAPVLVSAGVGLFLTGWGCCRLLLRRKPRAAAGTA